MTRALVFAALASAAMISTAQAQTIGTALTDVNVRSGPDPQFPVIGMIRDRQRVNVIACVEGSRWCQVSFRGRVGWAYSQYMALSGAVVAVIPAPEIEVDVTPRTTFAAAPAFAAAPIAPLPVPIPVPVPVPVATYQSPAPVVAYQPPAPLYQAPVYQAPAPVVAYQAPAPIVTYQSPATPAITYTAPTMAYGYGTPAPAVTYRAPGTTTVVETTAAAPRDFAGSLIPPREVVYAATTPPRAFTPSRSVRTYISMNPIDTVWLEGSLVAGATVPDEIDLMPVPNTRYQYAYVNNYPVLIDPASRQVVYVYR
jgi:hypothetical protein